MALSQRYRAGLLSLMLVLGTAVGAIPQDIGTPALDPVMLGQGLTMSAAIRAQANNLAARKGGTAVRSGGKSGAAAARLTYTSTPALRQQIVRDAATKLNISVITNGASSSASEPTPLPITVRLCSVSLALRSLLRYWV